MLFADACIVLPEWYASAALQQLHYKESSYTLSAIAKPCNVHLPPMAHDTPINAGPRMCYPAQSASTTFDGPATGMCHQNKRLCEGMHQDAYRWFQIVLYGP